MAMLLSVMIGIIIVDHICCSVISFVPVVEFVASATCL